MINSGNMSKVTRRHQTSVNTAALEYDGLETPVLIRLPDLSASPPEQSTPPDSQDSNEPHAQKKQRRRRRFDRSHALAQQERRETGAKWFEQVPKSRVAIAALILAAIGITYVLIPSGSQSENESSQIADPWSTEQPGDAQPDDVQVVMPSNLWPPSSETSGPEGVLPLNPTQGLDSRQTASQQPAPEWSDSGISLASPSRHSLPIQPGRVDQVTNVGGEIPSGTQARRVSNQGNWPDSSQGLQQVPTRPFNRPSQPQSMETPSSGAPFYSAPAYPQETDYRSGTPQSNWSGASLSGPEVNSRSERIYR